MQAKVGDVEEGKHRLPPHVHGNQLAPHHISKVFDHPHGVQLTCMLDRIRQDGVTHMKSAANPIHCLATGKCQPTLKGP